MNSNITQLNDVVQISKNYAEQNLTALYQAGKGGKHDGLTVLRRSSSRGNTHVTVEAPDGSQWKISSYWQSRSMRFAYSARCVKTAGADLPEEVIEERWIGGVQFVLRRVLDSYVIEENVLGDSYVTEPPYKSLTEARFAFEIATGQQVAKSQDYGADYGDGEAIGYAESTRPWEF